MSDLAAFQTAMKEAMIAGGEPARHLADMIAGGGLTPEQRVQVHQNNYRQTLTGALLSLFPLAQIFVGEAFMKGALARYIAAEPPTVPVLARYGRGVASFLDDFPPIAQVPYIPDIVRLEWAIHELQVTPEAAVAAEGIGKPRLSPNARLVDSDYPVLNLWMAGTGQLAPEAVNLKSGGQCAAVLLQGGEVRIMALDKHERQFVLALDDAGLLDDDALTGLKEKAVIAYAV